MTIHIQHQRNCVPDLSDFSIGVQTQSIIVDLGDIHGDHLTIEQRVKLAYALGLFEHENIRNDSLHVAVERNVESLMNLHYI